MTSPDELRERIAREISAVDGHASSTEPCGDATYEQMADAALAVVAPELERRDAEIARLEALALEKHGLFQGWRLAAMEDRRQKLALWAERDALRAQLAALPGLLRAELRKAHRFGIEGRTYGPGLATQELLTNLRVVIAPVSESVPATPEPARDRPSMVAHPELDFPECLTEFHRGVVFGCNRAIEEFEDRCRDLDQAAAAPYWDVVRWLEGKVRSYRDQAARVQAPSGVDLPEVEAALPSFVTTKGPCCGHAFDRHNKLSGCMDCACTVMQKDHHHAEPPAAASADTTPRVWVEGDVALDQTNFVHRRFESGWRTYPRDQGVQYGDDLMEAGLGPMLRLAGVPSETDNLGHLSLLAAERVRASASPSSLPQEGGTDG